MDKGRGKGSKGSKGRDRGIKSGEVVFLTMSKGAINWVFWKFMENYFLSNWDL